MLGIFDSGSGGLTVMRSLVEAFPNVSMLYLGDHARAPYGDRTPEEIRQFTHEAIDWLLEQGCDRILLACNTASAVTKGTLGDKPLTGIVEPTLAWLAGQSKDHTGLLATTATVASGIYDGSVAQQRSCPAWALFIEKGDPQSEGAKEIVRRDAQALLDGGEVKTVVLGCTHYPYFHDVLADVLPEDVKVVDQGSIIVDWLREDGRLKAEHGERFLQFFTTGDPLDVSARAGELFGSDVTFKKADLGG